MTFVRSRFWKGSLARACITSSVWRGIRPHILNIQGEGRWILGRTLAVRFWLDNWMGFVIADRIGIPHFARAFLTHPILWFGLAQYMGPFIPAKQSTTIWRLIHGRLPPGTIFFPEAFPGLRGVSYVTQRWRTWTIYFASVLGHATLSLSLQFEFGFGHWFLQAVRCTFSPQVTTLCRLCIVTIIWVIWDQRIKRIFEGSCFNTSSLLTTFWAFIRESGEGIHAVKRNSLDELAILVAFGVKGRPPRAPNITRVRWQIPLIKVIKINVDGGAAGSPSSLTGGGFSGIILECFGAALRCRMAGGLLSRLSSLRPSLLSNLPMIRAG
ncbi:hypothetical protein ACS0TY_034218 [Phlomoides rotata]